MNQYLRFESREIVCHQDTTTQSKRLFHRHTAVAAEEYHINKALSKCA